MKVIKLEDLNLQDPIDFSPLKGLLRTLEIKITAGGEYADFHFSIYIDIENNCIVQHKNSLDEEDPSSKMFLTGTIDGGFQEDPGAQNEQMVRCAWVSSVDVNFGYPIPNADLGFGELDEMVYFEDWIKNPEYVGSASKALQNALLKVFPNSKETPFDEYWGLRKKLYFLYQAALDAADDKKFSELDIDPNGLNAIQKLADALNSDYKNPAIKELIESRKNEDWKDPENYWKKILTNQMHIGSNAATLNKRMETEEFEVASNFKQFSKLSEAVQKATFEAFVPGGRTMKAERKVENLMQAVKHISEKGLDNLFNGDLDKEEIIQNLSTFEGIGSKQARNILMDLCHPDTENDTIPVDTNWGNVGEYLGKEWNDSDKHEEEICSIISEMSLDTESDWETDRLMYFALNDKNSETCKLIKG